MLSQSTAQWLYKRAADGNLTIDRLEFEPAEYHDEKSYFQITGIYDGALDEEFVVGGNYEINVADWLAEEYARCRELNGGDWTIDVYQFYPGALVQGDSDYADEDVIGDRVYRLVNGETVELAVDDAGQENPL